MSELVERYVHQVGRYLPPKERDEIEAELRSQIQDQLEDRYGRSPSQEEVVSVLAEWGEPYLIAASYNREQYLIGPKVYPYMQMVLRYVWLIVPAVTVFVHLFDVLTSSREKTISRLLVEPLVAAAEATFVFTALVVLLFALFERFGDQMKIAPFNPLNLPEADHPAIISRFEVSVAVLLSIIVLPVFFYWLYVGGLTLRFDLNDPGEVIPFPETWMVVLILVVCGIVILHLLALRRNRWDVGTWLAQIVLEVSGVIPMYFVIYKPVFERVLLDIPELADTRLPEFLAVLYAVTTLINSGSKLVTLWNYRNSTPLAVQADKQKV